MKKVFIFITMLYTHASFAQNLISNPSFEDTIFHNGNCLGSIEWAVNWFNPNAASPDLFTYSPGSPNCIFSSYNNPGGYQLPHSGFTYVGIYTYSGATREYVAIKLDSSLSNGCTYYIEFYISRANKFGMATDKIGCAFTHDTTGFYATPNALPLSPAIQSQVGILITDTLNWIKISGNYIANGTEQFLLIGNFYDNANTYYSIVDSSAPYYNAYYYIDDVRVLSCDSTLAMGVYLPNKEMLYVYPNPATNVVNIFYQGNAQLSHIELYEFSGIMLNRQNLLNVVKQQKLFSSNIVKSGCYLLKIYFKNQEFKYYKINFIN